MYPNIQIKNPKARLLTRYPGSVVGAGTFFKRPKCPKGQKIHKGDPKRFSKGTKPNSLLSALIG
ncbi:hypothetical protein CP061683_1031 [Chlamydia psittaci 06-1683]|nr:hypothetical protein CP061683_1031 [Chlamydia psittaci 06-1683]